MIFRPYRPYMLYSPLRRAFFARRLTVLLQELCGPQSRVQWGEPGKRKLLRVKAKTRSGVPFTVYYNIDLGYDQAGTVMGERISYSSSIHPEAHRFVIEADSVLSGGFLDVNYRCDDQEKMDYSPRQAQPGEIDQERLVPEFESLLAGTRLSFKSSVWRGRLKIILFDPAEKYDRRRWGEPQMATFTGYSEEESQLLPVKGLEPIFRTPGHRQGNHEEIMMKFIQKVISACICLLFGRTYPPPLKITVFKGI
jgi:hypothetical protein